MDLAHTASPPPPPLLQRPRTDRRIMQLPTSSYLHCIDVPGGQAGGYGLLARRDAFLGAAPSFDGTALLYTYSKRNTRPIFSSVVQVAVKLLQRFGNTDEA